MYKKFLMILSLILLLSSCWGDESTDTSLKLYDWAKFSMSIPTNWNEIENVNENLPKASIWNIELAASSTSSVGGFANNLLILSADLTKATSSKDYSMLNNIWAETDYLEYLKLSSKEINFTDWDSSIAYEFEAKYNYDAPKLKFIQTAHVCDKTKAYLITIALPTNVSDISRYIDFISTFTCK